MVASPLQRLAVVTGGSRGIGLATSRLLADKGYAVAILARDEAQGQKALASLSSASPAKHTFISCDVSDPVKIESAVREIHREYRRIDALVNAAGISFDSLLLRQSPETLDKLLRVNLYGPIHMSRHVCKVMLGQKSGSIVNVGSVVGSSGNVGQVAYSASKSGLIGLTRSLAKELGPKGIRVNLVEPGYVETDMTEDLPLERKREIIAKSSLQRLGTAEEVAQVIEFLLSAKASFVTGQTLRVDGGLQM